ncbi:histidine phosphatase family protein [Oleidesulfovibrio sp.]|uniref:histidine phosphatase family protein n=1 Tax=Oleidesulfovibrio sp. TaxID=2909707 RepID=UPI003A85B9B8
MNGRIAFFRHAATSGGTGRAIGRTHVPLSPQGLLQAQGIATAFGYELESDPPDAAIRSPKATCHAMHADTAQSPLPVAALYSSPAVRARQTLAPLCSVMNDEPATVLPELDEIDLGRWEGMHFDAIKELYPDQYTERGKNIAAFRPPQGESFMDVQARMRQALARVSLGPFPAVAVTHAGWLRTLLCYMTGTPLDDLFRFSPPYACAVVLELDTGIPSMLGYNLRAHEVAELLRH